MYFCSVMLAKLLITTGLMAIVSSVGIQFLDCFWSDGGMGLDRKCCSSDQLPKDCECWDISSKSDYTNTLNHKPQCPAEMNVTFYLYTRAHKTAAQIIKAGQANIKSTSYNGSKKTVFIVHGYADKGGAFWCAIMKTVLLDQEDINVIIVDWQQGAKAPNYFQASANTRSVGSMVARLIKDMNKYAQAAFVRFHLIGHCLGAHLVGYAGKEVFRLTEEKVGRISGLDPAAPYFEDFSTFVRISSTDAQFVDIIHSSDAPFFLGGFGILASVGHVDFYPNGGLHQPGCPLSFIQSLPASFKNISKDTALSCSHDLAYTYFIYSIQRCRYTPPNGNAACTMGYHVSRSCRGEYSPITTNKAPFC